MNFNGISNLEAAQKAVIGIMEEAGRKKGKKFVAYVDLLQVISLVLQMSSGKPVKMLTTRLAQSMAKVGDELGLKEEDFSEALEVVKSIEKITEEAIGKYMSGNTAQQNDLS